MNNSNGFLWSLSICKIRSDILASETKAIILSWWASKTHMSPNKKEVVRRRLAPKVYEEKPTQYLMET
jgi:hypothetical protein